jgi:hypothetical protein
MIAINRKQIPICQEHHDKYHNGTLSETEMKLFRRAASHKTNSTQEMKTTTILNEKL